VVDSACRITAELDPPQAVRAIVDGVVATVGADRGALFFGHRLDSPFVPVYLSNVEARDVPRIDGIGRAVLRDTPTDACFVTADAAAEARLAGLEEARDLTHPSMICARVPVHDVCSGMLFLDARRKGCFDDGCADFVAAYSKLAAVSLRNARRFIDLRLANERLTHRLEAQDRFWDLPIRSEAMQGLRELMALAGNVECGVLLLGEPGSEVESVARGIHAAGPRALRPFLSYNCSAGPRHLLEIELFGHARGPSGGPHWGKPGLLRMADRGVLFLDEVTALDDGAQQKLRRFFQDGMVRPVRSRESFPVDVQIIAATRLDPRAEVRARRFDRELLYHLSTFEIRIPPLRARPADVVVLLDHFTRKHGAWNGGARPELTRDALGYLERHSWPGNTAELEWLAQRLLAMATGGPIDLELIRQLLAPPGATDGRDHERTAPQPAMVDPTGAIRSLAEVEREAIREALIRTRGNRSKTARLLGVQRNTLLRRIEHLNVPLDGIPNRRGRK